MIPESTLRGLDAIPTHRAVAMLIRHAERGFLADGDAGYEAPLTDEGHAAALALGHRIGHRLRSVHASPLVRTMQTAARLAEGAGLVSDPVPDRMLGDPGAFVLDDVLAGETWRRLGHTEVMRHFVNEDHALPGCAEPAPAAAALVRHLLAASGREVGVHAFASHDALVTTTAARTLGVRLTPADWPTWLEAVFLWADGDAVHGRYRDWKRQ